MLELANTPFSAPQSRHSVFVTKDLHHARAHLDRTFQPARYRVARAAQSGPAFQNFAQLSDRVALSFIRFGRAMEIQPGPLHDFYLVQIPTKGHADIEYGGRRLRIDPTKWSLISPVQPPVFHWSTETELLEIKIKRTALEATLAQISGIKAVQPIEFDPEFRGVDGRAESLYQLLAYICQQLEQSASSIELLGTRARLEELILAMVLESQQNNYSDGIAQRETTAQQTPPQFIRLAVDYIASHADESLRLSDIAQASGASVRSLNAGFQRYRHTTPMEFLKNTRLDYVRSAMVNANQDHVTVTDIASHWGFNHLGRFAAEYKKRFGECPSDTLNPRPPRDAVLD